MEQLLATKFHIPPARPDLVQRPLLVERLSKGLDCKLTLVSAPAGFGKTTLLSEFVSQIHQPAGWVSLDESDNDPAQFWKYLISACRCFKENTGESALELFDTQQTFPAETIPTILINDFMEFDRPLILVLDDYHIISNPSLHAGLQILLDHLPPDIHVILSTRVASVTGLLGPVSSKVAINYSSPLIRLR